MLDTWKRISLAKVMGQQSVTLPRQAMMFYPSVFREHVKHRRTGLQLYPCNRTAALNGYVQPPIKMISEKNNMNFLHKLNGRETNIKQVWGSPHSWTWKSKTGQKHITEGKKYAKHELSHRHAKKGFKTKPQVCKICKKTFLKPLFTKALKTNTLLCKCLLFFFKKDHAVTSL